jgi:hypothetical protein
MTEVLINQLTNLENVLVNNPTLASEDIRLISETVGVLKLLIAINEDSK